MIILQSRIYLDFNSYLDYNDSLDKLVCSLTGSTTAKSIQVPTPKIKEINLLSSAKDSRFAFEVLIFNPTYCWRDDYIFFNGNSTELKYQL